MKIDIINNNSVGDWEGDNAALLDFFFERCHSAMSEKQYHGNNTRQKNDHEFE